MKTHISHRDFQALAEIILEMGREFRFRAAGSSMSPLIRDGDVVTIAPCKNDLRVGDVVLFRAAGGRLLLHRIVGKRQNGVLARGDAHDENDGFVPYESILGCAVEVSGRGYSFHLRPPFGYLAGRCRGFVKTIYRIPLFPALRRMMP